MDKLFTDKASGKDTQRPQFDALLSFAREGDTVVVHSMDRLARNLDDLRRLVQTLTKRGIRIEFVKAASTMINQTVIHHELATCNRSAGLCEQASGGACRPVANHLFSGGPLSAKPDGKSCRIGYLLCKNVLS